NKGLRQWLQIDSQKQQAFSILKIHLLIKWSGINWVREACTSRQRYEGQFPGSQGGFPMRRKATKEA
ncbi:hypothetical protein BO85DRAFT_344644, partial [Aspergillus piperis CBS 112811]